MYAMTKMMQLVLGQAADADAPTEAAGDGALAAATDAAQVQSVLDYIQKGGVMMIPIGIASLIMLAVAVERLLSLRRKKIIPSKFLEGLQTELEKSGHDSEHALAYCDKNKSPIASICSAGIKKIGRPVEAIEKAVQDAGEWEVFKLRKNVRILSVVAAIAPLMGLVGTIFGMIRAFQTVATSGEALGKTELLAEGIYEAMVTTAAGLLVAIPALIFYHWISAKIEKLVADMDRVCIELIESSLAGAPITGPRLAQTDKKEEVKPEPAGQPAVAS
jgi:biopolymer transport protein ExbB